MSSHKQSYQSLNVSAHSTGCGVRATMRSAIRSFPLLLHSGTAGRQMQTGGKGKTLSFCVFQRLFYFLHNFNFDVTF